MPKPPPARPWRSACSTCPASAGVYLGHDFISVTKADGRRRLAAGEARRPRRDHGALPVRRARSWPRAPTRPSDDAEEFFDEADHETVVTIKDLLETRVRPAVAGDGGDITFRGYKEGVVYLEMKGACSGCPSSTATLRNGVQNLFRHFLPEVREVQAV